MLHEKLSGNLVFPQGTSRSANCNTSLDLILQFEASVGHSSKSVQNASSARGEQALRTSSLPVGVLCISDKCCSSFTYFQNLPGDIPGIDHKVSVKLFSEA